MHACTSFVLIVLAFGMATGYDSQGQDDLDGTLAEHGEAKQSQSQRESRVRKRTEKGELYDINRLKTALTTRLAAVNRKRNEITQLMNNEGNLHLVKSALDSNNDLFTRYQYAYHSYCERLTLETDRDCEMERYEQREKSFMEFRNGGKAWIALTENQLAEQLDHDSVSETGKIKVQRESSKISEVSHRSKDTHRSISGASSLSSTQVKERAKIAELFAEKLMLRTKQAIKAAEEELKLDIEIAKAQAREKMFDESNENKSRSDLDEPKRNANPSETRTKTGEMMMQQPPTPHPPVNPVSASRLTQSSPVSSVPSISDSNDSFIHRSVPQNTTLPSRHHRVRSDTVHTKSNQDPTPQQLNSTAPEFHSKLNPWPRPANTNSGAKIPQNQPNEPLLERSGSDSWQHWVLMQQRHNEHIIETNRQLAVAMTLPQPEVPKFKGDPLEYQPFIMAFQSRIESKTNLADCLYYLNQYLHGEPKELISGCLYSNPIEGYYEAKGLLDREYGDPYKVSTAYINKVLGWSTLKYDDATGLKQLSFFLKKCNQAMKSLSYLTVLNHPSNMQIVVRKLPFILQNRWRHRIVDMRKSWGQVATFDDLVNFVDTCSEAMNDLIYSKAALSQHSDPKEEKKRQDGYKRSSFSTNIEGVVSTTNPDGAGSTGIIRSCPSCNQQHDLEHCRTFLKKSIEEKKSFLKEKKLCFGCYGSDHMVKGCLNKKKCKTCGKRHPTALHIPGFKLPGKLTNKDGSTGIQSGEPTIFHSIIPVRVRHKDRNKVIDTYAFYDNGSDGCFLTQVLKDQLELSGTDTTLRLGTMHGQSYVSSTVINNLIVTDVHDQNPVEVPKLYTREFIPVEHKQIPTRELLTNWKHLEEVSNEIASYNPELEIGLLIGSKCPLALEPHRVVPSEGNGPFEIRLRHR